ncbi:hypothetical protein GGF31_003489, partial [Allomyces arbusculus]
ACRVADAKCNGAAVKVEADVAAGDFGKQLAASKAMEKMFDVFTIVEAVKACAGMHVKAYGKLMLTASGAVEEARKRYGTDKTDEQLEQVAAYGVLNNKVDGVKLWAIEHCKGDMVEAYGHLLIVSKRTVKVVDMTCLGDD